MEKSRTDLLAGIEALDRSQPFPDEVFESVFDIRDMIERQKYIEDLRRAAKAASRVKEFDSLLGRYREDYIQKQKRTDRKTGFTDQPAELYCGEWTADDMGVRTTRYSKDGAPIPVTACSHPILPVEILKNVDTSEEKITLAYFKNGEWQRITADRRVCADNTKIVSALSQYGVEVTSENAKYLVRYISDCVGYNPVALRPKKSIGRLGWFGSRFMPYEPDIRYEENSDYAPIYRSVHESGDFTVWKDLCAGLRKDARNRLIMGASFASVLLEPLHVLPFVCHVWGKSGTCKTVAVMAAMSVWGDSRLGHLTKIMNGTVTGIMRNAAYLCSIPFAGDELQTIKDRRMKNYDQLIYQITEGVERIRGRRQGGVEETMTWKNTFIFTGEEPVTKAGSSDGAKNRVIEIFIPVDEPLMEDGNYVSSVIHENFGFAGRKFVEHIQSMEPGSLAGQYRELFDEICAMDTTDKQAMAMSCILLGDRLASHLFWPEEKDLRREDWEQYLKHENEVDSVDMAFDSVLNWAARNPIRFEDPKADDSPNRGEVWGRVETDGKSGRGILVINRDTLMEFLRENEYDYTAMTRGWREKGYLMCNSQGKFVHQTKVYGIRASYIKLLLPEKDDVTDEDGFVEEGRGQDGLPFD